MKRTDNFLNELWGYYDAHARLLPWRQPTEGDVLDPYRILVSEMMLQQTQVNRVIPKYHEFLRQFPDVRALATASLSDVLAAWSGLGYNRRAKFLHHAAQLIVQEYDGLVPTTVEALTRLPGIGHNTAAAIVVYAYSQPALFIETNVRTVYLHHFFKTKHAVTDTEIRHVLAKTLDQTSPREFYWALMDYGTHLKATTGNANVRSKHYVKQSRFLGSKRQLRGQVIKQLLVSPKTDEQLQELLTDDRLPEVLRDLQAEGLIMQSGVAWRLP